MIFLRLIGGEFPLQMISHPASSVIPSVWCIFNAAIACIPISTSMLEGTQDPVIWQFVIGSHYINYNTTVDIGQKTTFSTYSYDIKPNMEQIIVDNAKDNLDTDLIEFTIQQKYLDDVQGLGSLFDQNCQPNQFMFVQFSNGTYNFNVDIVLQLIAFPESKNRACLVRIPAYISNLQNAGILLNETKLFVNATSIEEIQDEVLFKSHVVKCGSCFALISDKNLFTQQNAARVERLLEILIPNNMQLLKNTILSTYEQISDGFTNNPDWNPVQICYDMGFCPTAYTE